MTYPSRRNLAFQNMPSYRPTPEHFYRDTTAQIYVTLSLELAQHRDCHDAVNLRQVNLLHTGVHYVFPLTWSTQNVTHVLWENLEWKIWLRMC